MDNFKNFAKVTVSTGYDASATSIALSAGHGARLPAPPFNATWWNSTDFPDPSDDSNVEIVRVTAIASDTLTITRGQESTTATAKNTASKTYKLIAGLTAQTLDSIMIAPASQGRLTLESGVPVPVADQTAKTTVYFTEYQGNCISLYDGTGWLCHAFAELSLPLGTLAAATNYDVFVYNNAGTLTLELSAAWASATARTDALILQDGIYVKSGATTRRYLGTFRTTSTTTTEDSVSKRFLWNNYNRKVRHLLRADGTNHTYDGPPRQWNNDPLSQVSFVTGLAEDAMSFSILSQQAVPSGLPYGAASLGLDTTTPLTTITGIFVLTSASSLSLSIPIGPQIGFHEIKALETTTTTGPVIFAQMYLTGVVAG